MRRLAALVIACAVLGFGAVAYADDRPPLTVPVTLDPTRYLPATTTTTAPPPPLPVAPVATPVPVALPFAG